MTKLNLEMGNSSEMVDFALRLQPDEVCLVPEERQEITTEGGLDLIKHERALLPTIKRLNAAGIRVSVFIDPAPEQVETARKLAADIVELHTGGLANSFTEKIERQEMERLRAAAMRAAGLGLQVNAGHGINYRNIGRILQLPHLTELNIGHSIVSRAVFVGLETAVSEMLGLMHPYRG
jgi:pyridoxine 5-phosphate synthase